MTLIILEGSSKGSGSARSHSYLARGRFRRRLFFPTRLPAGCPRSLLTGRVKLIQNPTRIVMNAAASLFVTGCFSQNRLMRRSHVNWMMMIKNVSCVGVTSLCFSPIPTATVIKNQSSHANGRAFNIAVGMLILGYFKVKNCPHMDTPSAAQNASKNLPYSRARPIFCFIKL